MASHPPPMPQILRKKFAKDHRNISNLHPAPARPDSSSQIGRNATLSGTVQHCATAADEKYEIWTNPSGIVGREGGNFSPPCAASNGSNSLNRANVEGEMWVLKGHPPPSSACLAKT